MTYLFDIVEKSRVIIVAQGEHQYIRVRCVLPRGVYRDYLIRNIGGKIYDNVWQVAAREDLASLVTTLRRYYDSPFLNLLDEYAASDRGRATEKARKIKNLYGDSILLSECLEADPIYC